MIFKLNKSLFGAATRDIDFYIRRKFDTSCVVSFDIVRINEYTRK